MELQQQIDLARSNIEVVARWLDLSTARGNRRETRAWEYILFEQIAQINTLRDQAAKVA